MVENEPGLRPGLSFYAKRLLHGGESPIIVSIGKTWQEQHQELWALLVPSSGLVETIQGEVIRITGRISNELEGNGGVNWDADYKKMVNAFLRFIKGGKQLSDTELLKQRRLLGK